MTTLTLEFTNRQGPAGPAGAAGANGADGIFSVIATQAEAEAGVENTHGMTPLRTAEAIAAQVQPLNAVLTAIAAVTLAAGSFVYSTDGSAVAATASTAYGRSLLALADQAAGRTALGLGTASTSDAAQFAPAARAIATTGLLTGGGDLTADRTFAVPIASQADAEAGAINDKAATPLRVRQYTDLAVDAAIAQLVGGAPAALDTLNELADALGDDPNFAASTATALGYRVRYDAAQALVAGEKATVQQNIGLVPGADVQAYDANLAAIAGLATAAGKLTKWTGAAAAATIDITAAGEAMLAAADAPAQAALLPAITLSGHALKGGDTLALAQADIAGLTAADAPQFAGLLWTGNNFGPVSDNGLDIGDASHRVRSFYVGTSINLASALLTAPSAATLQLGAVDAATPVVQSLQVQSVAAGASNTAGPDWNFNASRGTGTGAGGKIIFNVAPAGSTGTAQNALAAALTIDTLGGLTVPGLGANSGTPHIVNANDTGIQPVTGLRLHFLVAGATEGQLFAGGILNLVKTTAGLKINSDTGLTRNAAGKFEINNGTTGTFRDLVLRDLHSFPQASLTPATNGELVVEATSNTTLTFKLKGSDGTVRSGTVTLA